jgi:zinc D-Ala-D-Ala carboxypeptidase
MQLSKNFNLVEMTKSQTATRKGIDNTPSAEHQANLQSLCMHVLQPIRDHFSQVVTVSSGYRSPELCLAIGSSKSRRSMQKARRPTSKSLEYLIKN